MYVELLKMPRHFQSLKQVLVELTTKTSFDKGYYYLNFFKHSRKCPPKKALHRVRGHPILKVIFDK